MSVCVDCVGFSHPTEFLDSKFIDTQAWLRESRIACKHARPVWRAVLQASAFCAVVK